MLLRLVFERLKDSFYSINESLLRAPLGVNTAEQLKLNLTKLSCMTHMHENVEQTAWDSMRTKLTDFGDV